MVDDVLLLLVDNSGCWISNYPGFLGQILFFRGVYPHPHVVPRADDVMLPRVRIPQGFAQEDVLLLAPSRQAVQLHCA